MNFDRFGSQDRIALIEGVAAYLENAVAVALDAATKTCLNCEHFDAGPADRSKEVCGLNGLTPPPSIAARGCDRWSEQIPF